MIRLAAQRYAQVFFDLARQNNHLDEIHEDLKIIHNLIGDSRECAAFFQNRTVSTEKQRMIVETLFGEKLHPETLRYFRFLIQKEHLFFLKQICGAFDILYRQAKGIVHARIVSSAPLNAHQVSAINQHLKLKLRQQVESQTEVDTHLLGGLKIQIGDRIYDYSLRNQLEKFKKTLINT